MSAKRVGKGQRWGEVGHRRAVFVCTYTSRDRRRLIKARATELGMTVSLYTNALYSKDIGPAYARA